MSETTVAVETAPGAITTALLEGMAAATRRDSERYRRLGAADIRFGLRVDAASGTPEAAYVMTFADFECEGVQEVTPATLDDASRCDCYVAAGRDAWESLIAHIVEKGRADAAHTLNTLVLADEDFHLGGATQLGVDAFYRLNATLQAFVEECAGTAEGINEQSKGEA